MFSKQESITFIGIFELEKDSKCEKHVFELGAIVIFSKTLTYYTTWKLRKSDSYCCKTKYMKLIDLYKCFLGDYKM